MYACTFTKSLNASTILSFATLTAQRKTTQLRHWILYNMI